MNKVKEKEYITILSAKIARNLLKKGYAIADIKAMKENKDKTVFIFKNVEGLYDAINAIQ